MSVDVKIVHKLAEVVASRAVECGGSDLLMHSALTERDIGAAAVSVRLSVASRY